MKIAVIGATGLVGSKMLKVLEERSFPLDQIIPVATEKSFGKKVEFSGKKIKVVSIQEAIHIKPDIALFSAGASVSLEWAPIFSGIGCRVIDNSSAWRMNKNVKLIVPEINGHTIQQSDMMIANPNCSTIQLVMALAPLHKHYHLKHLVVSTYQSVSGSGIKAIHQLESEENGTDDNKVYPHQIYRNCLPHCDVFLENGFTKEEMKIVDETRKILDEPHLKINSTAVRVPVIGGHSESVYAEFENALDLKNVREIFEISPGITLQDNVDKNNYPMPVLAEGSDQVFVGRIRKDLENPRALNLWIVSDNLRKGAATNAVQIAELVYDLI